MPGSKLRIKRRGTRIGKGRLYLTWGLILISTGIGFWVDSHYHVPLFIDLPLFFLARNICCVTPYRML